MKKSKSLRLLEAILPGEGAEIYHPDMKCNIGIKGSNSSCSLIQVLNRLKQKGWKARTHHTSPHVVIIYREA